MVVGAFSWICPKSSGNRRRNLRQNTGDLNVFGCKKKRLARITSAQSAFRQNSPKASRSGAKPMISSKGLPNASVVLMAGVTAILLVVLSVATTFNDALRQGMMPAITSWRGSAHPSMTLHCANFPVHHTNFPISGQRMSGVGFEFKDPADGRTHSLIWSAHISRDRISFERNRGEMTYRLSVDIRRVCSASCPYVRGARGWERCYCVITKFNTMSSEIVL